MNYIILDWEKLRIEMDFFATNHILRENKKYTKAV